MKDSALGPRALSSTALACRAWSHCLTSHTPAWSHSLPYACTSTENKSIMSGSTQSIYFVHRLHRFLLT